MGNKIVTEADRKRTPRPQTPNGVTLGTPGRGQRPPGHPAPAPRGRHARQRQRPPEQPRQLLRHPPRAPQQRRAVTHAGVEQQQNLVVHRTFSQKKALCKEGL